jgi:uncharacterized protein YndB with AHSA1/START domain
MLKLVLVVGVLALAAVLIAAALRPDTFRVERAIQINASADRIYPLIDDFHRWTAWSPWEKRDPALKRDYSGAASGKGAVYAWEGNKEVGQGRMEILEAVPPSRIVIKLDFFKPFEAHNTAEFTLQPGAAGTELRWAMYGPQPYLFKLMGLFFSMDKMVGKDFDDGLASIKAIAEQ